mgnify:FL=1
MVNFVKKPVRWMEPFGQGMTEAEIDELLTLSPFRFMDESSFPYSSSLRGILAYDARINEYKSGDILIHAGDYGTSAFLVLKGNLRAVLYDDNNILDARPAYFKKPSLFTRLAQMWRNSSEPEARDYGKENQITHRVRDGKAQAFIKDMSYALSQMGTVVLGEGSLFGEIGALTRAPRQASVFAETDTQVIEIRYQGLRDLRRYDDGFRDYVDDLYRERSLSGQLRVLPLFADLPNDVVKAIAAQATMEAYGEIDWHKSFRQTAKMGHEERLQREPSIVAQGDYINDLIIIGFGFARTTRNDPGASSTAGFLSQGDVFGLDEIIANETEGTQGGYETALSALGYVDIIRIPAECVRTHILPNILKNETILPGSTEPPAKIDSGWLAFLIETHTINGRYAMAIDMDKCVRCDDCVVACANAHDGNPRFIRHGAQFANFQIANACMHCVDASCLLGCPTGAIQRGPELGRVIIDDKTCIGCATCANSCSYNNIRMVGIADNYGNPVLDQETHKPIMKATKCDLCVGQLGGPACQKACPTGALERVNFSDFNNLPDMVQKV